MSLNVYDPHEKMVVFCYSHYYGQDYVLEMKNNGKVQQQGERIKVTSTN